MMVKIHDLGSVKVTADTHPSHLPDGPFKTVFQHLWDERHECDRGTPMWNRIGRVMEALIATTESGGKS